MTSEVESPAEEPAVAVAPEVPLDFGGREIKVGATIAYAVRAGSSLWLQKRVVSGIQKHGDGFRLSVYDPAAAQQRRTSVRNLHTVVILENPED